MFNHVVFNVFHDYSIAKLSLYYRVVYSQSRKVFYQNFQNLWETMENLKNS